MDYSNGSSIDLNENNLNEADNIGRGAIGGAYADWGQQQYKDGLFGGQEHQSRHRLNYRYKFHGTERL